MTDARSPDDIRQTIRRHWSEVARSTRPIDRVRAAAAVKAVYRAATGRPPTIILFFDSPAQAEIASGLLVPDFPTRRLGDGRPVRPAMPIVRDPMWNAAGGIRRPPTPDDEVHRLEEPVRAALDDAYHTGLDPSLFRRALDTLRGQLTPRARDLLLSPLGRNKKWLQRARRHAKWAVSLRQWMALAIHHSVRRTASPNPRARRDNAVIDAVMDVCGTCGWCWFYPEIAVVSDRPQVLRLDTAGRLHAEDGPALAYRDGFAIHAVNGVRVPRRVIERPDRISADDVENELNAEVRRVLIERMSAERYLAQSGAIAVARDETGTLWRRNLPDRPGERGRAWCFVEVVNGTPEPDGSHKRYFLRVPPTMLGAREAVAWTYGLSADGYQPHIRT